MTRPTGMNTFKLKKKLNFLAVKRGQKLFVYVVLFTMLSFFSVFFFAPFFKGFYMSFHKWQFLGTPCILLWTLLGYASWKNMEQLLPFTDLILYDLKHMDSEQHRQITGVSNNVILNNLSRLDQAKKAIWVRLPLVPGYNDDEANYHALGLFLSKLNHIERIEILPYHRLAGSKYAQMGIEYQLKELSSPEPELVESRRQILLHYGLTQTFSISTDAAVG